MTKRLNSIFAPTAETFTVNGVHRQAIVFAPSKKTDKPPLVFGWHGHRGSMQHGANMFRFQALWPEAVVVYPQGLPIYKANDLARARLAIPAW